MIFHGWSNNYNVIICWTNIKPNVLLFFCFFSNLEMMRLKPHKMSKPSIWMVISDEISIYSCNLLVQRHVFLLAYVYLCSIKVNNSVASATLTIWYLRVFNAAYRKLLDLSMDFVCVYLHLVFIQPSFRPNIYRIIDCPTNMVQMECNDVA